MQYLVIAYDYDDALEKRLEVRDEHVKSTKELMAKGNIIKCSCFNEDDKMVGSTLFVEFENDDKLEEWLEWALCKSKVWNYEEIDSSC